MDEKVSYRWMNGWEASDAEWERIESILAARGWMSLNRNSSRILVAEDWKTAELIGFLCLQMVPHTEPLYVRPSARATGVAEELANRMVEFLTEVHARGWFVVADSEHARKLCEERGMKRIENPVYVAGGL